jgi:hypothetical protein
MYVRLQLMGVLSPSKDDGEGELPGFPSLAAMKFDLGELVGLEITRGMIGRSIDVPMRKNKAFKQIANGFCDMVNIGFNIETGRIDAAAVADMIKSSGGDSGIDLHGRMSDGAREAWEKAGLEVTPRLDVGLPAVRN